MPKEIRSGLETVAWLTLYVAFAPFVVIAIAMFLAKRFLELDESWGIVFGAVYLGLVFAGAREFAKRFERPLASSRLPKA